MWDVVIVGARAAGAATALLLARQGARVLAVDRAAFPSDTLSTHQLQPPGVDRLRQWGLLDALRDRGTPGTGRVRFDIGGIVLDGRFPGGGMLFSPRRTVLDQLLVDAARAAGAEVVEGYHVESVLGDGDRVTGIRGRDGTVHRAGLVVGADGKHTLVGRRAAVLREHPARTVASYSYWAGVEVPHGELYQRPGRAVAAFPTNDGLTMVYAAAPRAEFDTWRRDPEGHLLRTVDGCGDLGERVRAGRRAERLRTTIDLPNVIRAARGPGWALVGDARMVMDPVTAQGLGNAFRDAADLAADVMPPGPDDPMFDYTLRIAGLQPPRAVERLLLRAAARRAAGTEQLLGVFAGTVPLPVFRRPGNLARILLSGLAGGPSRRPRAVCPP